jgi:hypothetical protein
MAIAVGLMLITLEDMARYGMLFTPSWEAAAVEPVISQAVIKRIQTSGDKKTHEGTCVHAGRCKAPCRKVNCAARGLP